MSRRIFELPVNTSQANVPTISATYYTGANRGFVRVSPIIGGNALFQIETTDENLTSIAGLGYASISADNIDAFAATYGVDELSLRRGFVGSTNGTPHPLVLDASTFLPALVEAEYAAVSGDNLSAILAAASSGQTIELPTARYVGSFTIPQGVTLKAAAGAHPVITGGMVTVSIGARLENIEIHRLDSTRISAQASSVPTDVTNTTGVYLHVGGAVVNCYIHDIVGDAIASFGRGSAIMYGNIIQNTGWIGPDRGHGHGIYTHNHTSDGGERLIRHNFLGKAYATCMKIYSGSINQTHDYTVSENLMGFGEFLVGGEANATNISVHDNVMYDMQGIAIGYTAEYTDIEVYNNVFHDRAVHQGINITDWETVSFHDNELFINYLNLTTPSSSLAVHDNSWYSNTGGWYILLDGVGTQNTTAIEASPWGNESTFSTTLPTTNRTFVWPNEYEAERATVVILNRAGDTAVNVDLSAADLQLGGEYRAHNIFGLHGDDQYFSFTYSGAPVSFPMEDWKVFAPYGVAGPIYPNPYPYMGSFLVVPANYFG